MGCCVSTQKGKAKTTPATPSGTTPKHHHHLHHISKSPPRAEEEAVKEVLSETPTPAPRPDGPLPDPNPYYYTPVPKFPHPHPGFATAILATANNNPARHRSASPRKRLPHADEATPFPLHPKLLSPPSPPHPAPATDEISEVSEISCVSEAVSTATEVDSEIKQRAPRSLSPGRARKLAPIPFDSSVRRERMAGKSPVKRSDPPPRWSGSGPGHAVARSRVAGPGIGEGSSRRSRSPGTRNVGRSPSGRRTGISPGRVRMVQPGSGPGHGPVKEEEGDPMAPSESLENPLVSLECFIFL